MKINSLTRALAVGMLLGMVSLAGCASKPAVEYRLDCRGSQKEFAECGKTFESQYDCKAAQQKMIREEGYRARDRGTCLRH